MAYMFQAISVIFCYMKIVSFIQIPLNIVPKGPIYKYIID